MDVKDLFRTKDEKEIKRIKELVETIDKAEAELQLLVGASAEPLSKRGRPKKNGQTELPIT